VKKLLFALVMLGIMVNPVFGAQTTREIIDDTLSITDSVAEADLYVADSDRITFFATLNNNRTTAAVTATVTVAMSVDGTNWQHISWYDVAGGGTPQTSEVTTAAETTYIGWIDPILIAPYIRIRVNATELGLNYKSRFTSADNATLTVTIVEDK
jgi:hypothetical protein